MGLSLNLVEKDSRQRHNNQLNQRPKRRRLGFNNDYTPTRGSNNNSNDGHSLRHVTDTDTNNDRTTNTNTTRSAIRPRLSRRLQAPFFEQYMRVPPAVPPTRLSVTFPDEVEPANDLAPPPHTQTQPLSGTQTPTPTPGQDAATSTTTTTNTNTESINGTIYSTGAPGSTAERLRDFRMRLERVRNRSFPPLLNETRLTGGGTTPNNTQSGSGPTTTTTALPRRPHHGILLNGNSRLDRDDDEVASERFSRENILARMVRRRRGGSGTDGESEDGVGRARQLTRSRSTRRERVRPMLGSLSISDHFRVPLPPAPGPEQSSESTRQSSSISVPGLSREEAYAQNRRIFEQLLMPGLRPPPIRDGFTPRDTDDVRPPIDTGDGLPRRPPLFGRFNSSLLGLRNSENQNRSGDADTEGNGNDGVISESDDVPMTSTNTTNTNTANEEDNDNGNGSIATTPVEMIDDGEDTRHVNIFDNIVNNDDNNDGDVADGISLPSIDVALARAERDQETRESRGRGELIRLPSVRSIRTVTDPDPNDDSRTTSTNEAGDNDPTSGPNPPDTPTAFRRNRRRRGIEYSDEEEETGFHDYYEDYRAFMNARPMPNVGRLHQRNNPENNGQDDDHHEGHDPEIGDISHYTRLVRNRRRRRLNSPYIRNRNPQFVVGSSDNNNSSRDVSETPAFTDTGLADGSRAHTTTGSTDQNEEQNNTENSDTSINDTALNTLATSEF
ncbi:unnamed protein product [Ambrosiozyma monospora]|uniref:Unnamed protein product n=1 Tax=Ambrosiozyma monospora TaxID=43982 RepID=A0ACB5SWC6_AMBMO|nr:unnamed protein product [Ambrosiozyma monospora]